MHAKKAQHNNHGVIAALGDSYIFTAHGWRLLRVSAYRARLQVAGLAGFSPRGVWTDGHFPCRTAWALG